MPGVAKTAKFGGKKFRLDRSTRLKRNATKRAKKLRDDGLTARIQKIGGLHRVYRGPRAK